MQINSPLTLLAGLSPEQFISEYWQKKPLLIRQAIPNMQPLLSRSELFALATQEEVQSRLVSQQKGQWSLKNGPFTKKTLPAITQRQWSVLIQNVDQHNDDVRHLLNQFRFLPDARLDDLMISYATEGGGVGPHFDSYDVFLLQVQGQREWRIGQQDDLTIIEGLPLKILKTFNPEQVLVLEPGDMLYLPPKYAHDGIALNECMTYSIGFRAPSEQELAAQLLPKIADLLLDQEIDSPRFSDPHRQATETPALLPQDMLDFATQAIHKALAQPEILLQAMGEHWTELNANVWLEGNDWLDDCAGIELDRRSKMTYLAPFIFLNGDSFRAEGLDAQLMQKLANQRDLMAEDIALLTPEALACIQDWCEQGWLSCFE